MKYPGWVLHAFPLLARSVRHIGKSRSSSNWGGGGGGREQSLLYGVSLFKILEQLAFTLESLKTLVNLIYIALINNFTTRLSTCVYF